MEKYTFYDDPDPPLNQPESEESEENSVLYVVFRLFLKNGCILSTLTVVIWAFPTYCKVMKCYLFPI